MKTNWPFLGLALVAMLCCTGADWRQFRGNLVNGVCEDALPESISGDSIVWKVELEGRGLSSPIIVGERVFVSASSGFDQDRLHLTCFDAAAGKELWQRQFWATGRTVSHPKMCNATPTPCSDGERIFASYSSNDVVCTDLDGNLLWFRGLNYDYPNASNSLGMSSSPIVVGNTLVVQVESDDEAYAFGLDTATGLEKWKLERPRRANWTSPTWMGGETPAVLLQSSDGIQAVDPTTGSTLWTYTNGASTIPSSAVVGNTVFVPSHGITALTPEAGQAHPKQLWNSGRLGPSTPSPLAHNSMVMSISDVKIAAADQFGGELLWELRVPGPFSASPIAAGEFVYLFNEKGRAIVVKATPQAGTIVSEFNFDETLLATPSASNGAIYLRSDGHLWKIGK